MYSSSPNDDAYVDTDSEIFKKYLEIVSDTVIFEGVTTSAARDDETTLYRLPKRHMHP